MVNKPIAAVLTAIVAFAVAQPATAAAPKKVKTTITQKVDLPFRAQASARGETRFYGKVKSKKDACEMGREVILYRTPLEGGPKTEVDSDESSKDGDWEVLVQAFLPGNYYAKVTEVRKGNKLCLADKSASYENNPGGA